MQHIIEIGKSFYYITDRDVRNRKFVIFVITGDNKKFWYTDKKGCHINKRSQKFSGIFGTKYDIYTATEIKRILWVEEHAGEIVRQVGFLHDYNELKMIANILELNLHLPEIP